MGGQWPQEYATFTGLRLIGLALGLLGLVFVYFPRSIVDWFVISLVFGFIGFRFPGSPVGSLSLGLWLAYFWLPAAVGLLRIVGVLD